MISASSLGGAFELAGDVGHYLIRERESAHEITESLFLYYLGNTCGMTGVSEICDVFRTMAATRFLKQNYYVLRNMTRVPSSSTVCRVLGKYPADTLKGILMAWQHSLLPPMTRVLHLTADGKCMRGYTSADGQLYFFTFHLASLHLPVWMETVGKKTNEVTSLLLSVDDLCHNQKFLFTMDALSTQTSVMWAITDVGSHVLLQVKGNQPKLQEQIRNVMIDAINSGDPRIMSTVDLGGFRSDQFPAQIINNTQCLIIKEDKNEPYDNIEDASSGKGSRLSMLEQKHTETSNREDNHKTCRFVDSLTVSMDNLQIDSDNKNLAALLFENGYLLMGKSNGRFERRMYWQLHLEPEELPEILGPELAAIWVRVRSIGLCVRVRATQKKGAKDKDTPWIVTASVTPLIMSYYMETEEVARLTREHWEVEVLHNILDVDIDEDKCRFRVDNAPMNCALLKRMAMSTIVTTSRMEEVFPEYRNAGAPNMSFRSCMTACHYAPPALVALINGDLPRSPFTSDDYHEVKIYDSPLK